MRNTRDKDILYIAEEYKRTFFRFRKLNFVMPAVVPSSSTPGNTISEQLRDSYTLSKQTFYSTFPESVHVFCLCEQVKYSLFFV